MAALMDWRLCWGETCGACWGIWPCMLEESAAPGCCMTGRGAWLSKALCRLLTLARGEGRAPPPSGGVPACPKLERPAPDPEDRESEPGEVAGNGDTAAAAVMAGKEREERAAVEMGGSWIIWGGGCNASALWVGLESVGGSVAVGRGSLFSGGVMSGTASAGLLAPATASGAGGGAVVPGVEGSIACRSSESVSTAVRVPVWRQLLRHLLPGSI